MIGLVAHCPRYNMEVYRLKESEGMKKFYKTYDQAFLVEMENNTGLTIPRDDAVQAIVMLYGVYDNLFVQVRKDRRYSHPPVGQIVEKFSLPQKNLELGLPEWATPDNLKRLAEIEKEYFQILTHNDEMKRLKASE